MRRVGDAKQKVPIGTRRCRLVMIGVGRALALALALLVLVSDMADASPELRATDCERAIVFTACIADDPALNNCLASNRSRPGRKLMIEHSRMDEESPWSEKATGGRSAYESDARVRGRSTAAVIIAVVHARLCAGDRMERFDERWGGGGAAGSRHWMKIDGSGGGSDGPG